MIPFGACKILSASRWINNTWTEAHLWQVDNQHMYQLQTQYIDIHVICVYIYVYYIIFCVSSALLMSWLLDPARIAGLRLLGRYNSQPSKLAPAEGNDRRLWDIASAIKICKIDCDIIIYNVTISIIWYHIIYNNRMIDLW